MKVRVGLTGGIGAGKSEVAKAFAAFGALVLDADALAREAVAPGTEAFALIGARWPGAVTPEGELDRPALARVVFADAGARDELNAIVHPAVRALGAVREREAGPEQIVVHDVPLLFEGGFYRSCDANVLVVANRDARVERVVARSGFAPDDVLRRMAAQIDPERARELADYVVDNDGSLDALHDAARDVFDDLRTRIATVSRRS